MRKLWIACDWVLLFSGVVLVLMVGLAWIGGAEAFKMIPSVVMGCLFMILGRNFIARGKYFPTYSPADNSEVAQKDQAEARRMRFKLSGLEASLCWWLPPS